MEWDSTKLLKFPIPKQKPFELAQKLDSLANEYSKKLPFNIIQTQTPSKDIIKKAKSKLIETLEQMIALQEELDWQCYNFYKITDQKLWMEDFEKVPKIKLGERAFEIIMAQNINKGKLETKWFERHGSKPISEIPSHWPEEYKKLVQKRIDTINNEKNIRLIEQPEHKRRWASETWDNQMKDALEKWLLNRLEYILGGRDLMAESEENQPATKEPELISCAQLTDKLRSDNDFLQVAELYKGRPDFDIFELIKYLVNKESVPFLPVFRYKQSGLRKRLDWENTWELQRKEDEIDARTKLDKDHKNYLNNTDALNLKNKEVGEIPVPPKYNTKDFIKQSFWKLRGKLDVPKERFISYPMCERENDDSLVITWAGWDELQQAQALAQYIDKIKEAGLSEYKIMLLLTGLLELIPWLKQWHNELDPQFGIRMGDYFADYIDEETRSIGKTLDDLKKIKTE